MHRSSKFRVFFFAHWMHNSNIRTKHCILDHPGIVSDYENWNILRQSPFLCQVKEDALQVVRSVAFGHVPSCKVIIVKPELFINEVTCKWDIAMPGPWRPPVGCHRVAWGSMVEVIAQLTFDPFFWRGVKFWNNTPRKCSPRWNLVFEGSVCIEDKMPGSSTIEYKWKPVAWNRATFVVSILACWLLLFHVGLK